MEGASVGQYVITRKIAIKVLLPGVTTAVKVEKKHHTPTSSTKSTTKQGGTKQGGSNASSGTIDRGD